ncbi:cytochrome P450 [Phellopilus nigrolimitatus]|nr:cytochrome P450 [Phellopilus nigrolimitatus]
MVNSPRLYELRAAAILAQSRSSCATRPRSCKSYQATRRSHSGPHDFPFFFTSAGSPSSRPRTRLPPRHAHAPLSAVPIRLRVLRSLRVLTSLAREHGKGTEAIRALSRGAPGLECMPPVRARACSKLREEVTAARKEHGDLEYDILMCLPYLDAVCRETLRMFPPVPQVNRTARKDIVLPLLLPMKAADGRTEIKEAPLKKNTNVVVSVLNANQSKRIWDEDAEEWQPLAQAASGKRDEGAPPECICVDDDMLRWR